MKVGAPCHWVIMAYSGSKSLLDKFCSSSTHASVTIKLCTMYTLQNMTELIPITAQKHKLYSFVPKALLYPYLSPYLHKYKRLWLLDQDIALFRGFNLSSYLCHLDSLAIDNTPPLVSQPLILESTQDFKELNYNYWQSSKFRFKTNKTIIAASSRYIEQQVPMFDSSFFLWFLESLIYPFQVPIAILKNGWGIDTVWCAAASDYLKYALNRNRSIACAILISGRPINHLNTKSISLKREKGKLFWALGSAIQDLILKSYPRWRSQPDRIINIFATNDTHIC
jgi:hypothetical protein